MYDLILRLRQQGKTIVMVLHDIAKALELSDKIVVMDKSQIKFDGNVSDCISSRVLEEVFDATLLTFRENERTYYIFE
jgi:iron complex transport system ATP-binding protein